MKTKFPLLFAVPLNLVVWNYFVSGSWGGFFSPEYFIGIHLTISIAAVLSIWLLKCQFLRSKNAPLLFLLSLLGSYFPPVLTVWLAYAAPQIRHLQFEGLSSVLLVAIIVSATSWKFWVPLGIVNFFVLRSYSKRAGSR